MLNLSLLSKAQEVGSAEPRDIFMSLSRRQPAYQYPRDVQTEVWSEWWSHRNDRNVIVKMNTGSGKTVVGLIILMSMVAEGEGPAVYVAPTKNLVSQVLAEAERLGVAASDNENNYGVMEGQSILVVPVQKVFNGLSVFGIGVKEQRLKARTILFDDAHACLETMREQFCIRIASSENAYSELAALLKPKIPDGDRRLFEKITEERNSNSLYEVPFYVWQSLTVEVDRLLSVMLSEDKQKFNYPLVEKCLSLCACIISSTAIEISPECLPSSAIHGFNKAAHRIFMSATLEDDGAFVTAMGLDELELRNVVTPSKSDDIGDRLMVLPQGINPSVADVEVAREVMELARKVNVAIIVPSFTRAEWWKSELGVSRIADSVNIDRMVSEMKEGHVGATVFVNRYDGIDLPGDACRVMVIDGLPDTRSLADQRLAWSERDGDRILSAIACKLEQGMGRGVRSGGDYCAIVLMQRKLAELLIRKKADRFFSEATRVQFTLSKDVWNLVLKEHPQPTVCQAFEPINLLLDRDDEWMRLSRDAVRNVRYRRDPHVERNVSADRAAFDFAYTGMYQRACEIMENAANGYLSTGDSATAGLCKQAIAKYMNFFAPAKAQEVLLSAWNLNRNVTRPIEGVEFQKLQYQAGTQEQKVVDRWQADSGDTNRYLLSVESVLGDLEFGPDTADCFEAALNEVASIIGLGSSRPEKDFHLGPDNLWVVDERSYFVIECKNGSSSGTICKSDCNQLNGSIQWFKNLYGLHGFTCVPVMIHVSTKFENDSSPCQDIRIMDCRCLKDFKTAVLGFARELASSKDEVNAKSVARMLGVHNLLASELKDKYTMPFTVERLT
jgi:hypothetical protein